MTYYATHPQSYYGKGGVSYDFPGLARRIREHEVPGALHIHFNGAGGNVAAGKYNDGSPGNRAVLAGRLANGMKEAFDAMEKTPIASKDVSWRVTRAALPLSERYQVGRVGANRGRHKFAHAAAPCRRPQSRLG